MIRRVWGSAQDALASRTIDGCGTRRGECRAGVAPAVPRPPQDAGLVVAPLWAHPGKAATVAGLGRATVQRYVAAYRGGGLDGLRQWDVTGPVSDLASFTDAIGIRSPPPGSDGSRGVRPHRAVDRPTAEADPVPYVSEGVGVPVASSGRCRSRPKKLARPRPGATGVPGRPTEAPIGCGLAGRGHVFFVDAAHFVFGTCLCCRWSIAGLFVRAASGRQRFNVLGAWNAVTRELVAITNTAVVNSETMSELLRAIAARGLVGPVTLVLDNARYHAMHWCKAWQRTWGSPCCSCRPTREPEPDRAAVAVHETQGGLRRYHPTFADFRAAIEEVLGGLDDSRGQAGHPHDPQLPGV